MAAKTGFEDVPFKYYLFEGQESVLATSIQGQSDLKLQLRYEIMEMSGEKFVLVRYIVLISMDGPQNIFSYYALSELRPDLEVIDATYLLAKEAYEQATAKIFPMIVRWYDQEGIRNEKIFS